MSVANDGAGVRPGPLQTLMRRLHFYIGLFIGPFLLVAALSGIVYALTPQLEDWLYADALYTSSQGDALPLARQIEAARSVAGAQAVLGAVRPAPAPGSTTRVMFKAPEHGPSESRALFIDPVTAAVRGDLTVYGTSGVLPLRATLDRLHRDLLLGDYGRLYSELAASWLWLLALGGLLLWTRQRHRRVGGLRRHHATFGLWLLLGLLFFSATGLTWSQWAGGNIGVLRAQLGMSTPSVNTALDGATAADAHAGHHSDMPMPMRHAAPPPVLFDIVLAAARQDGIASPRVEIKPAMAPDKAWTVTEIDRRWPTRVDAVAVDPRDLAIVDRLRFADFPLAAKLTRWGIDAHMGVLFGLANQALLVAVAAGLLAMVVWGYLMVWRRKPWRLDYEGPWRTLRRLPASSALILATLAVGLGIGLPVLGASLLLFLLVDALLFACARRPASIRNA